MDNLSRAGLVLQIDDGHKWKYYELTPKGKEIVQPTGSRVFVILALSLFAVVFTAWDMVKSSLQHAAPVLARAPAAVGENVFEEGAKEMATDAAGTAGGVAANASLAVPQAVSPMLPYFHIVGMVVFTAIFGISLGYLIARRMNPPTLD